MSYININEVDKTVQDLAPIVSDNIVYVPLNSSDGPSGIYNIIQSYGDFVSIYGNDPNPDSPLMSSWDFAANLLLRRMPVMVRRITRKIDEYGNDTNKMLAGAALAKGLLKVYDVLGNSSKAAQLVPIDNLDIVDPATGESDASVEFGSDNGHMNLIEVFNSISAATPRKKVGRGNGLAVRVNGVGREVVMPQITTTNNKYTFTQGGGASITNLSDEDLLITKLKVANLRFSSSSTSLLDADTADEDLLYMDLSSLNPFSENAGKVTIPYETSTDPVKGETVYTWQDLRFTKFMENGYFKLLDTNGNAIESDDIVIKNAYTLDQHYGNTAPASTKNCLPVLVVPAGYTLSYSWDYGDSYIAIETYNKVKEPVEGDVNSLAHTALEFNTMRSNRGYNTITLVGTPTWANQKLATLEAGVVCTEGAIEPEVAETVENAAEYDKDGYINLFKMYYRFIGTAGNNISVSIKTTKGDGIYLHVFSGKQRLETIQLVNFRYTTALGHYAYYDVWKDRDVIWNMLLSKFEKDGNKTHLVTNYLDIFFNEKLDLTFTSYLDSIYMADSSKKFYLTGGQNPDDDDVLHEVYKTYAPLKDKYLYDIKFVSNGGFVDPKVLPESVVQIPHVDEYTRYVEDAQVQLASSRGDCLALVDIPLDLSANETLQYYSHISTSYAAAYAPWVKLNLLTKTTKWCPGSFAALWSIAKSVANGNDVYAPPAGVNRALLPECVDMFYQTPSEYIDSWQDNYTQFINPIVYINGYGVSVFGQRTLLNRVDANNTQSSALQYLNVRLVANEVKKKIFKTCIELTFEHNTLHTWLQFKSKMTELLDVLLYNNAITGYDVVMDETTMTTQDVRSNRIVGIVRVAVQNTAEKFDITFELTPNQVNFMKAETATATIDAYGINS